MDKGVKPPEAFGERTRHWSLGHAGDEGPHLSMTGESWGCSRAAASVCGFSRGTTARSVIILREEVKEYEDHWSQVGNMSAKTFQLSLKM